VYGAGSIACWRLLLDALGLPLPYFVAIHISSLKTTPALAISCQRRYCSNYADWELEQVSAVPDPSQID